MSTFQFDINASESIRHFQRLANTMRITSKELKESQRTIEGYTQAGAKAIDRIKKIERASEQLIERQKKLQASQKANAEQIAKTNAEFGRYSAAVKTASNRMSELDNEIQKARSQHKAVRPLTQEYAKLSQQVEAHRAQLRQLHATRQKAAIQDESQLKQLRALEAMQERLRIHLDANKKAVKRYAVEMNNLRDRAKSTQKGLAAMAASMSLADWSNFTIIGMGVSKVLHTIGRALTVLAQQFDVAAGFEKNMAAVRAITNTTGAGMVDQFKMMQQEAIKMGETTVFTSAEAAQGLRLLGMAGLTATQATNALGGALQLAVVGEMDLADAADFSTNILAGFRMGVEQLTQVNDVLVTAATRSNTTVRQLAEAMRYAAPVASNMNISLDETTALLGVLANAGIKSYDAGTDLRQAFTRLDKVAKSLNMTFGAGTTGGEKFIEIMKKIREEGWSAAKVHQHFGMIAQKSVLVIKDNIEVYQQLVDQLKQSRGAADRLSKSMQDNLIDDLKMLKSAWESLLNDIYMLASPTVRGIVQWFTDAVRALKPVVVEVTIAFLKFAKGVWDISTAVLKPFAVTLYYLFKLLWKILLPLRMLINGLGMLSNWFSRGTGKLGYFDEMEKNLRAVLSLNEENLKKSQEITREQERQNKALKAWVEQRSKMRELVTSRGGGYAAQGREAYRAIAELTPEQLGTLAMDKKLKSRLVAANPQLMGYAETAGLTNVEGLRSMTAVNLMKGGMSYDQAMASAQEQIQKLFEIIQDYAKADADLIAAAHNKTLGETQSAVDKEMALRKSLADAEQGSAKWLELRLMQLAKEEDDVRKVEAATKDMATLEKELIAIGDKRLQVEQTVAKYQEKQIAKQIDSWKKLEEAQSKAVSMIGLGFFQDLGQALSDIGDTFAKLRGSSQKPTWVADMGKALSGIGDSAVQALGMTAAETISAILLIVKVVMEIPKMIRGLLESFASFGQDVKGLIKDLPNLIQEAMRGVGTAFGEIVRAIFSVDFWRGMVNSLIGGFKDMFLELFGVQGVREQSRDQIAALKSLASDMHQFRQDTERAAWTGDDWQREFDRLQAQLDGLPKDGNYWDNYINLSQQQFDALKQIETYQADSVRFLDDIRQTMLDTYNSIVYGELNPQFSLTEYQKRFDALVAKVEDAAAPLAERQKALQDLSSFATTYLTVGQTYLASSARYSEVFDTVTTTLARLAGIDTNAGAGGTVTVPTTQTGLIDPARFEALFNRVDSAALNPQDQTTISLLNLLKDAIVTAFKEGAQIIYDKLKGMWDGFLGGLNQFKDNLIGGFNSVKDLLIGALQNVLGGLTTSISNMVSALPSLISNGLSSIGSLVSSGLSGIGTLIANALGGIGSTIGNNFVDAVKSALSIGVNWFADGGLAGQSVNGMVSRPTMSIAGEEAPEWVVPTNFRNPGFVSRHGMSPEQLAAAIAAAAQGKSAQVTPFLKAAGIDPNAIAAFLKPNLFASGGLTTPMPGTDLSSLINVGVNDDFYRNPVRFLNNVTQGKWSSLVRFDIGGTSMTDWLDDLFGKVRQKIGVPNPDFSPGQILGGVGKAAGNIGGTITDVISGIGNALGFANGGVSTSPQLAWVSEGRYKNEAHVPLPDGRRIPVSLRGDGQRDQILIGHLSTISARLGELIDVTRAGRTVVLREGQSGMDRNNQISEASRRGILPIRATVGAR